MSAIELLQWSAQAIFVGIALVELWNAARRPTRASVDAAAFFAAIAGAILVGRVNAFVDPDGARVGRSVAAALAMAIPYLLLRLLDDFAGVQSRILRLAELGLAASVVAVAAVAAPLPAEVVLPLVAYFAAVSLYAAVRFLRESRRGHGVTRRRMQAVAAGIALLAAVILTAAVVVVSGPEIAAVISGAGQVLTLLSAIAFFVGFSPPRILRRAWQEPELRAFLQRAASLPRLPDTASIVAELERGAGASLGARATIGLWDPQTRYLRFRDPHGALPEVVAESRFLAWRAFHAQHAAYYPVAERAHPENAAAYRRAGVRSVLVAPITAGKQQLGVLEVYTEQEPIFDDDDLALVRLLADQAAVVLESRALIDEAARVRAHEEAARLKEDFLSAAAHDLKTPLTTLVAQAQLLERKLQRDPSAPPDAAGVQRIVRESKRLNDLVLELLDASRAEQGRLVGEREPGDLVAIAREVCDRVAERDRCVIEADAPVIGRLDRVRMAQVFQNLVENALKYSNDGQPVRVRIWQEEANGRVAVQDHGIGIPPEDLPHVFERFRRASNVDSRRFTGMGLGLYIVRNIVEEHGGQIWVESDLGKGTTFQIALPVITEGRLN